MTNEFGQFMTEELSPDAIERLNQAEVLEKEARLIPKGSYEGVITEVGEPKEAERGPYQGKLLLRVTADLFNVGDTLATRKMSFNLSPFEILNDKGNPAGPYKLFGQFTKATGTKNLQAALDVAQNTRLKYRIEVIKARSSDDTPNNFVAAITTIK